MDGPGLPKRRDHSNHWIESSLIHVCSFRHWPTTFLIYYNILCMISQLICNADSRSSWSIFAFYLNLVQISSGLTHVNRRYRGTHSLQFFYFSPVCVFKWVLKLPTREDTYSRWLHLYDSSVPFASTTIMFIRRKKRSVQMFSIWMHEELILEKKNEETCAPDASSNSLLLRIQIQAGCMWSISLHSDFSCAASKA